MPSPTDIERAREEAKLHLQRAKGLAPSQTFVLVGMVAPILEAPWRAELAEVERELHRYLATVVWSSRDEDGPSSAELDRAEQRLVALHSRLASLAQPVPTAPRAEEGT